MKISKYTSLFRNFRGFNYQRDFTDEAGFNLDIADDIAGRQEICWAYLFRADTGRPILKYRRGMTEPLQIPEDK